MFLFATRHLSVLPVLIRLACSCPPCQRCCAASLQDISAVLARPANDAARLALRAQAGRKATRLGARLRLSRDARSAHCVLRQDERRRTRKGVTLLVVPPCFDQRS